MFATPLAYSIDEEGMIALDAAVGVERILNLITKVNCQRSTGKPRRAELKAEHEAESIAQQK